MPYRKREYLSISTLTTFARCPRRYFYSKNGLTPMTQSPALSYGQAMHKAIPAASQGNFDTAWKEFTSVWDDSLANDVRNNDRAHRSLSHYVHEHKDGKSLFTFIPPPSGNIEVSEEVHEYEVPFAIDIGLPIPLVGRLDGLVQHRDTKKKWGYEFKTTSGLTAHFFKAFELNVQILVYGLVLRTLGEPIEGVMVEGMLCSKTKVANMLSPVYIQDHHLEDILIWLKYYGNLLLACEERMEFPKDFTGCNAYTNFYVNLGQCEYMDLCLPPKWEQTRGMYLERPEHRFFTSLTTGASE